MPLYWHNVVHADVRRVVSNQEIVTDQQKLRELERNIRRFASNPGNTEIFRTVSILRGATGSTRSRMRRRVELSAETQDRRSLSGSQARGTFSAPQVRGSSSRPKVKKTKSRPTGIHQQSSDCRNYNNNSIFASYESVELLVLKLLFLFILIYFLPTVRGDGEKCDFLRFDVPKLEQQYNEYAGLVGLLQKIKKDYLPDESQFIAFTLARKLTYIISPGRWPYDDLPANQTYVNSERICTERGGTAIQFASNQQYGVYNFTKQYGFHDQGVMLSIKSFRQGHVAWADGTTSFLSKLLKDQTDTPAKREALRYLGYFLSWDGSATTATTRVLPSPYTLAGQAGEYIPFVCMVENSVTVELAQLEWNIARSMVKEHEEFNTSLHVFSELVASAKDHNLNVTELSPTCPDVVLLNLHWPKLLGEGETWPYDKDIYIQMALLHKWKLIQHAMELLPSALKNADKILSYGKLIPARHGILGYLFSKQFNTNLEAGGIFEIFALSAVIAASIITLTCIGLLVRLIFRPSQTCSLLCSQCRRPPNPCSFCYGWYRRIRQHQEDGDDEMEAESHGNYGIPLARLDPVVRSNNVFLRPRMSSVSMGNTTAPILQDRAIEHLVSDLPRGRTVAPRRTFAVQLVRK